jgi:trans-aconitate methyltransferase
MFFEEDVAAAYAARPPYPTALFDLLQELADPQCGVVLDAGTGTGDLARPMASRFERVDALDPSAAMIEAGRREPGGSASNLRWILGSAETGPLGGPYGLVVAGQSLAWMEWSVVLPRWKEASTTRAWVAIVERTWEDVPWRAALKPIISQYSRNREFRPYDLVEELSLRGLFRVLGSRTVSGEHVDMTPTRLLDGLHSQNGLARSSLGSSTSTAFDREVVAALSPFLRDGLLSVPAGASVTWGVAT